MRQHVASTPPGSQRLIFLHIPKAGGTTLNSLLYRQFKQDEMYCTHLMGDRGFGIGDARTVLLSLPAERRAQIRLLYGHMAFGLHEDLPGPSIYITMLRFPIDRVLSSYYYILSETTNPYHEQLAGIDLLTFAQGLVEHRIDNVQVRLISGFWDHEGPCSPRLLEIAIDNLKQHFAVVGLMERFDDSLLLMKKKLGWEYQTYYMRQNVTKGRPQRNSLPRAVVDVIEQSNQLDIKLYEYVRVSFEQTLLDHGVDKPARASFQMQLHLYQRTFPIIKMVPPSIRRKAHSVIGSLTN